MSQFYTVFKNETISNRGWFIGWLIGIGITVLMIGFIYPGDDGMASFVNLLEDEAMQAFFGAIGGTEPGYTLWVAIMFPFISIILFIFSINSGVKIVTGETDKRTGELVYVLPLSRRTFFFAKWLAMTFYLILIILFIFIGLITPINGYSVDFDRMLLLTLHTVVYTLSGVSIGIILGIITGRGDKGQQIALLSVLFMYTFQSLGNLYDELDPINRVNILKLFDALQILLQNEGDNSSLFTLFMIFILGLIIGLNGFEKKDLIENRGLSLTKFSSRIAPFFTKLGKILKPISNFYNKIMISITTKFTKRRPKIPSQDPYFDTRNPDVPSTISNQNNYVKLQRTARSSIFTFWARPLENKFPITADFIYSERRVLLIVFWAIVTVYPLQLAIYPGDELIQETIEGFGSGGIMKLFTYSHDLNDDPYLWYVITQAIGGHWIYFLPLVFMWVKKVTIGDAEKGTGEILGSQPISHHSIILQRLFAILLELIFIVITMVTFLILSEEITGATSGLLWEIIAIAIIIPFYFFWTSLLISIALILKGSGVKIARIIYFLSFLLFVVGIMIDDLNIWYVKGIFGLYDPVLIIQEQSIFANNGGIIIIFTLSLLSLAFVRWTSRFFSWSLYDKERDESTYTDPAVLS
ncbi:MAG: ABC transporter permease subunit [Candidatus Kariarchaeaceae archaeon]|jgi:hypothetical protein